MSGKGFKEVYNLKGGIKAWQGNTVSGPPEEGMVSLRGDERPDEILIMAYGMEEGLGSFYSAMVTKTDSPDVAGLFTKLARAEEGHKNQLFKLYRQLDPSLSDRAVFEEQVVSAAMEGGLTPEEFLAKCRPVLTTVQQVLDVAMMIEAQALDLYMRYSDSIQEGDSRAVLYDLAEAEKAHLQALGRLMDGISP